VKRAIKDRSLRGKLLIRRLMGSLPPEYRDVVVLRLYGRLSYAEVAEQLGVPEGTVKSRFHRSIRLMQLEQRRGRGFPFR